MLRLRLPLLFRKRRVLFHYSFWCVIFSSWYSVLNREQGILKCVSVSEMLCPTLWAPTIITRLISESHYHVIQTFIRHLKYQTDNTFNHLNLYINTLLTRYERHLFVCILLSHDFWHFSISIKKKLTNSIYFRDGT